MTFKLHLALAAVALGAPLVGVATSVAAAPANAVVVVDSSLVTPVSGGCGPNGWRGPWGHCNYARSWGARPAWGYYGPVGNGCPPGYWHGPWGHCRNTPYHGALPGGGWK